MRKTKFVCELETQATGEYGARFVGVRPGDEVGKYYYNFNGSGAAHDLMEHVNGLKMIGETWDELQALGAAWFVRGESGTMQSSADRFYHDPIVMVASSVHTAFEDALTYGLDGVLVKPCTRVCEADEVFHEVLAKVRDQNRRTLDAWDADSESYEEAEKLNTRFLDCLVPHMRIGYRKARRKWKNCHEAGYLFWQIANAMQHYCSNADEYDGQTLTLHWGDGKAWVEEPEYDDV